MKLTEVLKSNAAQSGIDEATIASILTATSSIDIPDEIGQKLSEQRYTKEAALNNPEFRKHYHGELYSTLGSTLENLASNLSDEDKAELKSEKLVLNRIPKLIEKIQKLEEQKATASIKGSEALTKKIDALNGELAQAKDSITLKEKEFTEQRQKDKMDWEFNLKLSQLDYSLPETIAADTKVTIARTEIGKKMQELGVIFKSNDKGITDVFNTDGTLYHDKNNRHLSIDDFIKQILIDAKLLNVAGKTPPKAPVPKIPGRDGSGKKISSNFNKMAEDADRLLEEIQ